VNAVKKDRQLISVAPFFYVSDVVKAAEYYRDMLGFKYERYWGDPPEFCMPDRDGQIVMLSQNKEKGAIRPNGVVREGTWDAYFWVRDADTLYEEFKRKGAVLLAGPMVRSYEQKEFVVGDLDGYVLCFGSHWPADKS
jgi:catechol 2,3-dioxygenase-like lactoylglutathione lyase family enzyme